MRFSDNGYYIEAYIKCGCCGALIYDEGVKSDKVGFEEMIFCSRWCIDWKALRASGVDVPRLPLD